jgi:hypothetical protein
MKLADESLETMPQDLKAFEGVLQALGAKELSGALTPPRLGPGLRLRAGLSALAVTACLTLAGCGGGGTVPAQDVPPAGTIWFGTAYDVTTFHLTGHATSFPLGQQVALVARMSRAMGNERVEIDLTTSGIRLPVGYTSFTPGNDIAAELVPPNYLTIPGQIAFQAQDAGGNVLAIGTITITP